MLVCVNSVGKLIALPDPLERRAWWRRDRDPPAASSTPHESNGDLNAADFDGPLIA
jgi:hypothetical protein